ncbi:hypothetical protein [Erwinia phage vB_Ea277G]|jgi:hypothetical protein|nr:hypothetical protein [Erwinia phage vB_Ea277G]
MNTNMHKAVRERKEKQFPVDIEAAAYTRVVTEAKPIVQEFLLGLGVAPAAEAA